jgi:hypothetical protein
MRRWARKTVVRRAAAATVAIGVAVGALVSLAAPAGAVISGGCTGEGTLAKGTKASGKGPFAAESIPASKVITIPLKDSVTWSGSVPVPATKRNISGFVAVKLPWPISGFDIDTWGGPSSRVANNGVKDYELPSVLPRGTVFQVYGAHHDANGKDCAGFVLLKIEGGAFDSPLTAIALAITVGLALMFYAVGRARAGAR